MNKSESALSSGGIGGYTQKPTGMKHFQSHKGGNIFLPMW